MNGCQPKDFIETAEGLIFAVVTEEPEEQRILAFLRYRKTESGYRKLSTREANDLLKTRHSDYLYFSKTRDVTLHGVHRDRIVRHHQPRKRLQEIRGRAPIDAIEEKLQRLTNLFEAQGLDLRQMGVTGSLLIGAHKPDSDIDLVLYRREAFFETREIIKRLLADQLLEPLDESLWQDAYARRGCTLSYEEYRWHEQRKYNKAAIGQTKFDISLLTPERRQNDRLSYKKRGRLCLRTTIANDEHRFDYPIRYQLDHPSIHEAISYTATYAGQALQGEHVEIQGQLEVSSAGRLRLVIGTDRESPNEYIKVISQPNP
ncbi:MAG: hypothetical protein P8103_11730 [Candidatus Thiodiazotropha sp.]